MNLTVDFSILGHAGMALSAMWRRPENRRRDERDKRDECVECVQRKEPAHEPVNLTGIRSEAFAEDLEDLEDLQHREGLRLQAAMPLPAR